MAVNSVNILIGKKRYGTTSDRQRERLQAQISTYALRHNADKDIAQQTEYLRKQQAVIEQDNINLGSLCAMIETYIQIVDRVVPCRKCGHTGGVHEIGCTELAS